MTSVVLTSAASSASSAINSYLGINSIPIIGSQLTSQLNSITKNIAKAAGAEIDEFLFGSNEENRIIGSRLSDLSIQTSTYGDVIPQIFGRVRIASNIIWASDIKEITITQNVSGGGKGSAFGVTKKTNTSYNYTVSFAACICDGKIDSIDRFWADSKLINIADFCSSYEIHKGAEDQSASAIIQSYLGVDKTPNYKNLTYIVFEDFDISSFGNRIPNLTFEVNNIVTEGVENNGDNIENLVTAINLIPGSGEFTYDTKIQRKVPGYDIAGRWIQTEEKEILNSNNASKLSDVEVSLNNMKQTFPNLEWVSIICTWFADSLDIANADILPKVEYNQGSITEPDSWSVANLNREGAGVVLTDIAGRPIYGGTPSDGAILNLIDKIKSMGYKVMFYPMIFMNIEGKPWRGYMTGESTDVNNFFTKTNGYNSFINHYATLTKNKVDAFIIGTEMKGLTSIQESSDNSFPAVDEFISLATQVKATMGSSTKISYAADWSEYHSNDGWFNLDKLWASSNIDFIGIDAYFPLSDEPQNSIYDLTKTISGWESGEGYDWYYSDDERTNKINFSNDEYAWKNIEYWWKNTHTNPDDIATNWVPESKKIWFTEFGFPSVDGATNQPNVFYNPDSVDGGVPRHSKGYVDILAQKLGIEATLKKWQDSDMVEEKILWAWDARPYPFWPDLENIWSDGEVWSRGHWVQGKLGTSNVGAVIKNICEKVGIDSDTVNVSQANELLEGYVINGRRSAKQALENITEPNFIYMKEGDTNIDFISKRNAEPINIFESDIVLQKNGQIIKTTHITESELPERIDINYIDSKSGYLVGNQTVTRDCDGNGKQIEINLPVVMAKSKALRVAKKHLLDEWANKTIYSFKLDITRVEVEAGDNLQILDSNENSRYCLYVVEAKINRENEIEIVAVDYEKSIYEDYYDDLFEKESNNTKVTEEIAETDFEIINLPLLNSTDNSNINIYIGANKLGKNWNGCSIYQNSNDEYLQISEINQIATMGVLENSYPISAEFIKDELNSLKVVISSGELESISDDNFLEGKQNYAFLGNELIKFQNAELIGDNLYELSGIIRGLFGTENYIQNHGAGTRFILLDNNLKQVSFSLDYLNKNVELKAVSFGNLVDEAASKTIVINGQNLLPYSVVNVSFKKLDNSDINISFNRRSRIINNWRTNKVPLAEAIEEYEIDIMNDDEIVRTVSTNESSFSYTSALQIEDFGENIDGIEVNIYQISDLVGSGAV